MVKKINTDAITIRELIKQGMKPINIAKLLGVSKQKVNYWKKTSIKTIQNRRKKLPNNYIEMSSRKITSIINE